MCIDPISIAVIGSSLLGAVGSIQTANANAAAQNYQARVQERNAQQATVYADDARRRGAAAEETQRLETRALIGRQRAILSERNIDISQGSSLAILGDTAQFGEMDAITVRNNFEREAQGYQNQSANFSADAALSRAGAKASKRAGVLGAVTELVGGATNVLQSNARRRATL